MKSTSWSAPTPCCLSEGVQFARLGLVITDEQHRFGVGSAGGPGRQSAGGEPPPPRAGHVRHPHPPHPGPHASTVTWTSLVLTELPPGRTPVETYLIRENKRPRLYNFVRKQVALGRQVYIVCPAVSQEEDPDGSKSRRAIRPALSKPRSSPTCASGIVHGKTAL